MPRKKKVESENPEESDWIHDINRQLDDLVRRLGPIIRGVGQSADSKWKKLQEDLPLVAKELKQCRHDTRHIDEEDITTSVREKTSDCLSEMERCLVDIQSALEGSSSTRAKTLTPKKHVQNLRKCVENMQNLRKEVEKNFQQRSHENSMFATEKTAGRATPKEDFMSGKAMIVFIIIVAMLAFLWKYEIDLHKIIANQSDPAGSIVHCSSDGSCEEYLHSHLKSLADEHSDQSNHLWGTFYSAALDHVRNGTMPKRPIIVMVLMDGPSTQRDVVQKVADTYRSVLDPGKNGENIVIEGKELKDIESEEVQRKIEKDIHNGYKEGSRAMIVYDFDLLPSCSVLTFHNFCNNEDAPYIDMAILLVVTKDEPVETVNNRNLEDAVMNKFHKRWEDCPSELPRGKIDAILSRVANNVVLLK